MALPVHSTLGSIFIGFAVSCVVYGVVLTQVFSYFRAYPGDHPRLKLTSLLILALATADQAFVAHMLYHYSIASFGDAEVLIRAETTWSAILSLTAGATVGFIVKLYFAFRVWRFSMRNVWVTGLVGLLTFAQLGLALAFAVECFKLPNMFAVHQLRVLGTLSLATGVTTDIVTAVALCFFLSKMRTGLKSSDSLVDNLCAYAINTGVLTSTVSVATLILYNVMPNINLSFFATYIILSKLYAISFMATLNTRRIVRGRGTDKQGEPTATNHTNMFHLGTRVPSMRPSDAEQWDMVYPISSFVAQPREDKGITFDDTPRHLQPYPFAGPRAV